MEKNLKYLIIDGTDGGGKTPLISEIKKQLNGKKVQIAEVFKKQEVFHLWEQNPIKATIIIQNYINKAIQQALENNTDLLIFDRHWPTVYVSTNNEIARKIIDTSYNTVLILNNAEHVTNSKRFKELNNEKKLPKWVQNKEERNYWRNKYLELTKLNKNNLYPLFVNGFFNLKEKANKIITYFNL